MTCSYAFSEGSLAKASVCSKWAATGQVEIGALDESARISLGRRR